jgi:hypothetical protein
MKRCLPVIIILILDFGKVAAQQVVDLNYSPPILNPAHQVGQGPRVGIDEGHFNFHTAGRRYRPFAKLLQRDGYIVGGLKVISQESLKDLDVIVIANPLHESNYDSWSLPTPSAFTRDEILVLRAWVEGGGSMLLIADHMPFPGAVNDLAKSFGVVFSNGFAWKGRKARTGMMVFAEHSGLVDSVVIRGRGKGEEITKVVTFAGSAFKAPKEAQPILVFPKNSISLEPKEAWKFTNETPVIDIEGWYQGATLKVGKGRLAVFGEAAMFTAQRFGADGRRIGMNSPSATQNYQLLLNVMHWLTNTHSKD